MQEEWIAVSTKMIISEARKWVVTYSISDFAGSFFMLQFYEEALWNTKVIVKSFTKCEISNDLDGAQDM